MNRELKKLSLNKKTIANLDLGGSNNFAMTPNCPNTPSDTSCGTNRGHTCNNANTCGYYTCLCTKKC